MRFKCHHACPESLSKDFAIRSCVWVSECVEEVLKHSEELILSKSVGGTSPEATAHIVLLQTETTQLMFLAVCPPSASQCLSGNPLCRLLLGRAVAAPSVHRTEQ
jgi:hypothetical protein